jgi:hypothetical protein
MMAKDPAERFPDLDTAVHALGAPADKKAGDVVRTQMISLAKSGPQKKVRMSVPMSPIPVQKKKPAAPTAVEGRAAAKRPKPEPAKSSAGKWIGIAAVVLLLAGGGGYYYMNFMQPKPDTAPAPGPVAQGTPQTGTPTAPATDSTASPAETKTAAAPAVPVVDYDSIAAAIEARQRDRQRRDSIAAAAKARRTGTSPQSTKTAPSTQRTEEVAAQQQAAAPPPAPVVPQTGTVKLGTTTPAAFLYINGNNQGAISGIQTITVPAGGEVRLSIRAENCVPWDTSLYVGPGQQITIGRRFPKCP